jgi:hypothetical protein
MSDNRYYVNYRLQPARSWSWQPALLFGNECSSGINSRPIPMPSLQIEQFFLGCLAHASYLVASDGIAAVIKVQISRRV